MHTNTQLWIECVPVKELRQIILEFPILDMSHYYYCDVSHTHTHTQHCPLSDHYYCTPILVQLSFYHILFV